MLIVPTESAVPLIHAKGEHAFAGVRVHELTCANSEALLSITTTVVQSPRVRRGHN